MRRQGFDKLKDTDGTCTVPKLPQVHVQVYDEKEETTCIEFAELLRASKLKKWLLLPLFSVLSLFVWPVILYWSKPKQREWLYRPAMSVENATHLYVEGRDGNKEIVPVYDCT